MKESVRHRSSTSNPPGTSSMSAIFRKNFGRFSWGREHRSSSSSFHRTSWFEERIPSRTLVNQWLRPLARSPTSMIMLVALETIVEISPYTFWARCRSLRSESPEICGCAQFPTTQIRTSLKRTLWRSLAAALKMAHGLLCMLSVKSGLSWRAFSSVPETAGSAQ